MGVSWGMAAGSSRMPTIRARSIMGIVLRCWDTEDIALAASLLTATGTAVAIQDELPPVIEMFPHPVRRRFSLPPEQRRSNGRVLLVAHRHPLRNPGQVVQDQGI